MTSVERSGLATILRDALVDRELEFEEPEEGSFFVKLPGTHKLATMTWLVIGIAKDHVDESQVGSVLMAGTACFVLPYLVLAAPAGYLADKFAKRTVIVGCKIAEIAIMVFGVVAILCGNLGAATALGLLFTAVALLGGQSALFSPARDVFDGRLARLYGLVRRNIGGSRARISSQVPQVRKRANLVASAIVPE